MAAKPPSTWDHFFPPKPAFTDKDLPADLNGKVYLITGANSGIGAELARVLYSKNAKVYMGCRSEERGNKAIQEIKTAVRHSKGDLILLPLDQADLTKVKTAAQDFLAKESRLDILFNNAGVMTGDSNPIKRTAQNHELALGVNCLGAFLLTKLLIPTLKTTAQKSDPGSVRIVWLSSYGLVAYAPHEKGIDLTNLDYHTHKSGMDRYGISKAGDWLLGVECARQLKNDGIVSVAINPGNVTTELARNQGCAIKLIAKAVCYDAIYGVYTELFAGFAREVVGADWTKEWVIAWGRLVPLRPDLPVAVKSKEDGGNGNAQEFWDWNEEQVKEYL